jgi:hypothetical protein
MQTSSVNFVHPETKAAYRMLVEMAEHFIEDLQTFSAQTPSLTPRCQERHPESGQCELRLGHDKIHLAGEYCWPVTTAEEKR